MIALRLRAARLRATPPSSIPTPTSPYPPPGTTSQQQLAQIPEKYIDGLCRACVLVHESVMTASRQFLEQLSRRVHVTPKSYLDLIASYMDMLGEKQRELMSNQTRLSVGVDKIKEANMMVETLQEDLDRMRPAIKAKIHECLELIPVVRDEQAKSEAIQERVQADELVVRTQQQEVARVQAEALQDLNAAMPALEASIKALDGLDKKDITEIRFTTSSRASVVLGCIRSSTVVNRSVRP